MDRSLPPRIATPVPGPRTRALGRRLRAVESRNVTFLGPDFPVFWTRASGANVEDADGNRFLDLIGAFGVQVAGHAHPRITEAICGQATRLPHGMGDVHPPEVKVEFLEALAEHLPWGGESRSVLASAGSEAVEIALKTALLATGRPGIVAFEGGYHGLTLGALATTERDDFRRPFAPRLYEGVRFVPFPAPGRQDDALAALARALAAEPPVGAVILEPIQGRGGVRVPPPGALAEVARLAREAGALVVYDEVFTGVARTGDFLALEHEGVVPDLVCLGKALGGGLPLSACAGPREVMDAWPTSPGEALHTSTFLGHPLACAAGRTLLEVVREEGLVARARELGTLLRAALAADARLEVRGRGAFLGFAPAGGGEEAAEFGVRVAEAALRRGVIVLPAGRHGEVVELSPPLVLSDEGARLGAELLLESVAEVLAGDGPAGGGPAGDESAGDDGGGDTPGAPAV